MSEPVRREGLGQAIEMPSKIISMEEIDGRLMVVLEDGRTIDMTDMFAGEATQ